MHESSIVESLIQMVRESVPDPRQVRRVEVRVGLLTGVSPDAMQFYFEIMREETLSPKAELKVELEPLRAHCEGCGADHSLAETAWVCPTCGSAALAFRNGDELHLSSVEVDDGQSIHD